MPIMNTKWGPISYPGRWNDILQEQENVEQTCEHDFVNVAFTHIKMVCKHCDQEQT